MWYLNPNRKFSPATLLWSNPENKTKEPWSRNFMIIYYFRLGCRVLSFNRFLLVGFPKKKNKNTEFRGSLTISWKQSDNENTPCKINLQFFRSSQYGEHTFQFGRFRSHKQCRIFRMIFIVDSVNDEFLWPQVKTILYSDCSLLLNIALHNVMLHLCCIITELKKCEMTS